MKVGILSDTHLGKGRNDKLFPERREDTKRDMISAVNILLESGADVLVHAGDVFDMWKVDISTFSDFLDMLAVIRKRETEEPVKVTAYDLKGNMLYRRVFYHTPLLLVHGNHDFVPDREENLFNKLESSGLIVYLHNKRVVVEKGEESYTFTGLGFVPYQYIPLKLKNMERGDSNSFFVFHFAVEGLYPKHYREPAVSPSLFPEGYRYYIGGHLHWIVNKVLDGKHFLIPGSTTITDMSEAEAKKERIVYLIEESKVRELPIPGVRKLIILRIHYPQDEHHIVETVIRAIGDSKSDRKPIVKVVLEGSSKAYINTAGIVEQLRDRALVYIEDKRKSHVVEKLKLIKEEVSLTTGKDIFTKEFVVQEVKRRMGDRWKEWMEDILLRALEGEDISLEDIEGKGTDKKRSITDYFT